MVSQRQERPFRVSFGGGGTDVEPFCVEQGGAIIGSTINKYAYCSIIPRNDDQITVHSLDFDMTVKYNAKENYVCDGRLDLVTAALRAMDIKQGCEVYLQCDAHWRDAAGGCAVRRNRPAHSPCEGGMTKWRKNAPSQRRIFAL